jgi:glutaredoxin
MPNKHLLFAGVALLVACGDFVSTAPEGAPAETSRPPGWQSLDDEAQAQRLYYQFVDEAGRVRFVESLDDVPAVLRANVGFVKMAVAPPLSPGDARRARVAQVAKASGPGASGSAPHVALYSADWCGACRKAKKYLDAKGVDYEERNIDDPRFAKELVEKTGQRGIPVIEVDGRVLTGFSAARYDELIGRA